MLQEAYHLLKNNIFIEATFSPFGDVLEFYL